MILVCFEVVTAKVVLLIARNTYSDNVTAKSPERIIMSNDLPNTTSTSQLTKIDLFVALSNLILS